MPISEIVTGAAPVVLAVLLVGLIGRWIVSAARPRQQISDLESFGQSIKQLQDQTQMLHADLEEQRAQLGEALERLDFTERLLTQVREGRALPPHANS